MNIKTVFTKIKLEYIAFSVLLIITVLILFPNVKNAPVQNWDEATNANVVYETVHSENQLTLRYENKNFFEKPPLWYWLTMIPVKLFGFNEISVRSISILSSFLLIFSIYFIAKEFFNWKAGFFASLTFFSIGHLVQTSQSIFSTHTIRSADLDTLQLLLILLTSYMFFKSINEPRFLKPAFAFTALAILTKGPFGLFPLIVYMIFLFLNRKSNQKSIAYSLQLKTYTYPVIIMLMILLPWYAYEYSLYGIEFIQQYFLYHIASRTLSSLEGHHENIFFYFSILIKSILAPGILISVSIYLMIKNNLHKHLKDYRFFLILTGVLLPLLIITFVQTKLSWYIFYMYPFASIGIGKLYSDIFSTRLQTSKIQLLSIAFIIQLSLFFSWPIILYVLPLTLLTIITVFSPEKIIPHQQFLQILAIFALAIPIYLNINYVFQIKPIKNFNTIYHENNLDEQRTLLFYKRKFN